MGCTFTIDSSEARAGGEAASEHVDPSALGKIQPPTKMRTLWALAIMLITIQGGALDLLESPPVGKLPVAEAPLPNLNVVPLNVAGPPSGSSSTQQGSLPRKRPAGSPGGRCAPAAKYFLSSSKLSEYLMDSLPPQIEELVKCEEVDLAGLVKTVLDTVEDADLLSILDVSSLLDVGGGLGLDGLLGKGGEGKSPKLPSLSKATDAVSGVLPGGLEGVGSLLPAGLGGDNGPVKKLVKGNALSDIQKSVDEVVSNVGDLKDSAKDVVKDVLPADIKNDVSNMLDLDIKGLLLELKIETVSVENMNVSMEGEGIQVDATATATIGGQGALGPVISLMGFGVKMDVTLKIDISSNNTQCVELEVQDTHVEITETVIKLVETVKGTVPLPVPLPLDDTISKVLSVQMNEKMEKSNSCAIVLSDFNDCKNSTGLFKFQIKSAQISQKGLSILYCTEALLGKKTVPVLGSRLPPDSKNANISIILSRTMITTLLTHAAKQSSANMDNLAANVTEVSYTYQKGKPFRATYEVAISKDGDSFATGKTTLIVSIASKIAKNKLTSDIKLIRSDHTVEPTDAKEEVEGLLAEVSKKVLSRFNELLKEMNVPTGVSSFPLTNAKVNMLKSHDLQASS